MPWITASTICRTFMLNMQGEEAVVGIPEGTILAGGIPANKMKLLQAWIEIHHEELIADWAIAIKGGEIFRIDPLH
jgi:hypothetical protein